MVRRLLALLVGTLLAMTTMAPQATANVLFNEYSIVGLSRYMTQPVPFTVIVDGPDAPCSMTYRSTTLTGAPWTFTWAVPDEPGVWGDFVEVRLCNGASRFVYFEAGLPFWIATSVLTPDALWATPADMTVSVGNSTDAAATMTVTDPSGRVLVSTVLPAGGGVGRDYGVPGLRVPLDGIASTTTLTTTVTGSGLSMSAPLVVARGWVATYGTREPAYLPCSTVLWSYSTKGQPKTARTFKADVVESLRRLSVLTGLTFHEVPVGQVPAPSNSSIQPPGIVVGWQNLGRTTAEGRTDGIVIFNSQDKWATDKYRGFGNRYVRPPGRGWMIVHEIMHTLWLDHVADPKAIMAPVNRGQHAFTAGDIQGLAILYPRTGCDAQAG